MARPRKPIVKDEFIKLCGMFCTLEEIANWFGCSEDTIERWCQREMKCSFADAFKRHSCLGRISLRRYLFKLAEKNPGVCIFMAKNYLGLRDDPQAPTAADIGRLSDLIDGMREPVLGEEYEAVIREVNPGALEVTL